MLDWLNEQGRLSVRQARLFAVACCRRIWPLLTDARSRTAVEVAENHGDGLADQRELAEAEEAARVALNAVCDRGMMTGAWDAAYAASACAFDPGLPYDAPPGYMSIRNSLLCVLGEAALAAGPSQSFPPDNRGNTDERVAQADLLRDICSPFRDGFLNASWRTPEVLAVANQVYEHCDFANLPFRHIALGPSLLTWKDGIIIQLARSAYEERLLPQGTLDNLRLAILADALEETGASMEIVGHLRQPDWVHVRGCWVLDLVLGKQ